MEFTGFEVFDSGLGLGSNPLGENTGSLSTAAAGGGGGGAASALNSLNTASFSGSSGSGEGGVNAVLAITDETQDETQDEDEIIQSENNENIINTPAGSGRSRARSGSASGSGSGKKRSGNRLSYPNTIVPEPGKEAIGQAKKRLNELSYRYLHLPIF